MTGWPVFDGNWVDCCSLVGGVVYAVCRCAKFEPRRKFVSRNTGIDIANGRGLFPLGVLVLSCFSSTLLESLLHANRLILSAAGCVATLEEDGWAEQKIDHE